MSKSEYVEKLRQTYEERVRKYQERRKEKEEQI